MILGKQGTNGGIEFSLDRIYGCNEGHKAKHRAKKPHMHVSLTGNLGCVRR